MTDEEATLYVHPGEPYIGEAVMHLLLAFNSEPNIEGAYPPREREHAQIAIALTMVALESIVKGKLFLLGDKEEPGTREDRFLHTLPGYTKEHKALVLWHELHILRNIIIHSAYFSQSTKGGKISAATKKRLVGSDKKYVDLPDERTKQWMLCINPLGVSRYEALVCLMLFCWYGKETGVWTSNEPLRALHVDCRMKLKWIDRNDYQNLIGEGKDFVPLIAYLSGRLPEEQRKGFVKLVQDTFKIDMDERLKFANDLLNMTRNERPS